MTLKGQKKTALGYACLEVNGSSSPELLNKLRLNLCQGLDKAAMDIYLSKIEKMVAKEEPTSELRSMMAGADFMPMVSETVSYRYSCRRSDCRLIPLRETQWLIGASGDGGKREMWFCPACGNEYRQSVKPMAVNTIGQDLAFNYVVFMQLEVNGRHTDDVCDGGGAL